MAPWPFEQAKTPYYTSDKNPSYHPSPQGRGRPPAARTALGRTGRAAAADGGAARDYRRQQEPATVQK